MAIPLGLLVAYTYADDGPPDEPRATTSSTSIETAFYPQLGYRADWAIEDPRYLVQNLPLFLAGLPSILPPCDPGAVRGLFDAACPVIAPRDVGMGLFLTSPAWLIAFASLRWLGRDRLVTGAAIAVVLIAIVDLMHFSQGWVQFGYRFSNDYAPFGLLLLALALEAGGRHPPPGLRAHRDLDRDRRLGRGLGPSLRMVTLEETRRIDAGLVLAVAWSRPSSPS